MIEAKQALLVGRKIERAELQDALASGRPELIAVHVPALDFGGIRGANERRYIAAVHSAMDHNYAPMTEIFREVIARTLKSAG
jgi:hypothetical protein